MYLKKLLVLSKPMQIESAETDPSASVGDCYSTAAVETNFGYIKKH